MAEEELLVADARFPEPDLVVVEAAEQEAVEVVLPPVAPHLPHCYLTIEIPDLLGLVWVF